jgi:ATP-binding cassette subfamily B protein
MKLQSSDLAIIRRVASQVRPYWLHILAVLLLSLLATPLALLLPLPMKIVIDSVLGSQPLPGFLTPIIPEGLSSTSMLAVAVGLLVGVTLLTHLQGLGTTLLQAYAGEGMVLDFRARLFSYAQRLSLSYHDTRGTADSAFRIQYDAPCVQHITIYGVIPLVSAASVLVGIVYVTAQINTQLAIVAFCVAPVLFLLTRAFGTPLRKRWKDVKKLESSANSVVQEVLSSMRVVKAFGREEHEQERFLARSVRRKRELLRVYYLQGGFNLAVAVTIALGTAATLYIGALHVQAGTLSLGNLILITVYISQLYEPLRAISRKLGDLQGAFASAERAFSLLDELPEVTEHPQARPLVRARGDIRFENVCFAYERGRPVLTEVSFDAPAGTRIGIQGVTGAGKSTLINLLVRFYDVNEGRILVDGVDVRDFKLADFRNQFGIVLQDAVLFSANVAENIAYGRPSATMEQIIEAAKLANAHEFICSLPQGYETLVGERGMRLSGGERQRVGLARAFLKDAPILILDEPTSSVDVGTEVAILEALNRLMHGRTTFMIAHRFDTLGSCEMRLEISGGTLRVISVASEEIGRQALVEPPGTQ